MGQSSWSWTDNNQEMKNWINENVVDRKKKEKEPKKSKVPVVNLAVKRKFSFD